MWIVGIPVVLYYGFAMPNSLRLACVAWIYLGACAHGAADPRARKATWVVCAVFGLAWIFVGGIGVGLYLAGELDLPPWPIPAGFTLTLVPIWLTLSPKGDAASR